MVPQVPLVPQVPVVPQVSLVPVVPHIPPVPELGSFSCCSSITPCYIVGPHSTVSNVFQHEVLCPVPDCTQTLSLCRWNSGSSAGHCPRFLHDMEHITLLVPAVYQCKQEKLN